MVASKAVGNPAELWIAFSEYFEKSGELDLARSVFEKAILYKFKNVDNLVKVRGVPAPAVHCNQTQGATFED